MNLDYIAAKYANDIVNHDKNKAKELVNQVTNSLGVLQEQGVYALMLYLFANGNANIYNPLIKLLRELSLGQPENHKTETKLNFYIDKILKDTNRLFLVRDVYEQTLIYARYGAKALAKLDKN